ncbi:MAG: hypothetical protein MRJ68_02075 [Nitrospira sp.]|nr:hypothetical protein [Nitrospira sp.]
MTKTIHSFKSVWDALADTPEQAANLRARSELMRQITDVSEENGWTQMEGATYPPKHPEPDTRIAVVSRPLLIQARTDKVWPIVEREK